MNLEKCSHWVEESEFTNETFQWQNAVKNEYIQAIRKKRHFWRDDWNAISSNDPIYGHEYLCQIIDTLKFIRS